MYLMKTKLTKQQMVLLAISIVSFAVLLALSVTNFVDDMTTEDPRVRTPAALEALETDILEVVSR